MIELLAMGYVGLSGHTVRIARSVAVARMLSTETVKPGGQNLKACSPHWGLNPGPSVYKTDALPLSYRGSCSVWFNARGLLPARSVWAQRRPKQQTASCNLF